MTEYTTFIFDFDFTLADATDGIVFCANYALKKMNLQPRGSDAIRKTVGTTMWETFRALTGITDKAEADAYVAHYSLMADEIMTENTYLISDAKDVLTRLKQSGKNVAVVTNKYRYRITDAFNKHGAAHLADFIVGLEDVNEPKPSPEGLLKAIDFFGETRQNVLYVGDSLVDAQTAVNAGVSFAAVFTGTTAEDDFKNFPPLARAVSGDAPMRVYMAESLTEVFKKI